MDQGNKQQVTEVVSIKRWKKKTWRNHTPCPERNTRLTFIDIHVGVDICLLIKRLLLSTYKMEFIFLVLQTVLQIRRDNRDN